jgi:sugar phosphate permease
VTTLIIWYGWRFPFVAFGALGILWAAVWYYYYRDTPGEHRSVNQAELDLIRGSLPPPRAKEKVTVPWGSILSSGNLWMLCLMYFCYGCCLAVYLDWFPAYLKAHRGFNLKQMGFYASLPLLAGVLGDFLGGWVSDRIGHVTGNLRFARKVVAITGFLMAAAFIVPATFTTHPYHSVWYSCMALFGLELTVGVSWAVPLDIGGDFAGTVSSVMNTCGNIGGAISTSVLGSLVKAYGWDRPFVLAAILCVAAAVLFTRIDANKQVLSRE